MNESNSTLGCFYDRFYEDTPETEAVSSSRALLLTVRTLLTTQAVSATNETISKQQTQLKRQLMEMWNAVDMIKKSIENSFEVTNSLIISELGSLTPTLSSSDESGHANQSASRLGRLVKIASSEIADPLTSTSFAGLEAMQKAGRTLHKALEFLAGLHDGFTSIKDTADATWKLLETQLNTTIQQAAQLQKELEYAAESTAHQINRTSNAIITSVNQTRAEISKSFRILRQRWQLAVDQVVNEGFAPWQQLGDRFAADLTANQRQSVRPDSSIQRKYILPDRTSNSSLEQEHSNLSRDERWQNATSSSPPAGDSNDFDIDTAVLRASLVDIGVLITQVVFYVDVGRLALLATDLAVGLITESYSDMPLLDIRGMTTVDTIDHVWEVFFCQHNFSAVCYTLAANASELMQVFVTFLIVFVAALLVTIGLFMWKREHIQHCNGTGQASTAPTTMQMLTRIFFENSGNTSQAVADPLKEIEKYATIINDSMRKDYAALELDTAVVWRNQSKVLDDLNDGAMTTSSLIRMLQDCTEEIGGQWTIEDGEASLASQCLTRTLSNTSEIVALSSDKMNLSANAPFLTSPTAFMSCFSPTELLPKERDNVVAKLQHDLSCATEKAVYFSFASWWLLLVVFVANRFIARMIIKAAGVYWWRSLSANRLQFTGFCRENGDIEDSNKLSAAIQRHLREANWQIISRFVGIGGTLLCVVIVIIITFYGLV